MRLIQANGEVHNVKDEKSIEKAIDSLGNGNEFVFLGTDNFIQVAISNNGFIIQYKIDNELKEFNIDSKEKIKSIFKKFFHNDYSFKADLDFLNKN